jgi:hypothetical protein
MDKLLDAKSAGELLGVPPSWLLSQARVNKVPHVRLGKYVRFDRDDLVPFVQTMKRGPRMAAPDAESVGGGGPEPS